MSAKDVAFTPAVKAIQSARGSRAAYARAQDWATEIDDELAAFIADQQSCFLATASADGQPYVEHRGGPRGFLRVIDRKTIAFADYRGNRQYITAGNLSENPRVQLFLIDYASKTRVKIWGRARVIEGNLATELMPPGHAARPEHAIVIDVTAWDVNCPQHIPQRLDADAVAAALAERDRRIAALEAELRSLRELRRE